LNIDKIVCGGCEKMFDITNQTGHQKFYFSEYIENDVTDFIDKIKYRIKKFSKFYSF
jgi:hypothetical protein